MRLLNKAGVAKKIGISVRSLDYLRAEGKFPVGGRLKDGPDVLLWPEHVVDDWLIDQYQVGA